MPSYELWALENTEQLTGIGWAHKYRTNLLRRAVYLCSRNDAHVLTDDARMCSYIARSVCTDNDNIFFGRNNKIVNI